MPDINKTKSSTPINAKYFQALVENLSDIILVVNAEGIVEYASSSFNRLIGYSIEETIGKNPFSFVHPDDLPRVKDEYAQLKTQPELIQDVTLRLIHKDGSVRYMNGKRKNLLGDPEIEGIILNVQDITDRVNTELITKENQDKLRRKESLLSSVEKLTKVGGWEYDVINKTMFWTEETYIIHEMPYNESAEDSLELIAISTNCYLPEDRVKITEAFNRCVNYGEPYELECSFITLKGKQIWIQTTGTAIVENDTIIKVIGNITDITEKKRRELLAQIRLDLINYSYNSSLEKFLQKTLDEAELLTQSKIGFFHFVEEDQVTLSLQAWSTNTTLHMCSAEGKGSHYNIDLAGVWVDCVHQRKAVIHNDYENLSNKKGLPDGHAKIIREAVVPIFRNNKIVAIIGVGNKENNYDDKDVELLTRLADLTWDIAERRRFEETLRESNEKYQGLFQQMISGFALHKIVLDENEKPIDYITLEVNREYEKLLNVSAEEIIGKRAYEATPDLDKEWIEIFGKVALTGEPCRYQQFVPNIGKWFEGTAFSPRKGEFAVTFVDFTDRKLADSVLKESEEKYRALFNNANETISIVQDGVIKLTNPNFLKQTGYTLEEIYLINPLDIIHPDDKEMVIDFITKSQIGKESQSKCSFRIIDKNKDIKWVDRNIAAIVWEGRPALLVIDNDITEYKRVEEEIKIKSERLRLSLSASNAGTWDWNIVDNSFYWSNELLVIFGMEQDTVPGFEAWAKCIHPDDVETASKQIQDAIDEKKELNNEYRIIMPDKSIRWIRATGNTTYNGEIPLRMSGLCLDITDRKHFEEELKRLNYLEKTKNEELASKNVDLKKARVATLNIIEDLSFEIEERKHAEELLKTSELKFRTVADYTFDWEYWEDENNQIVYMSPSCERVTGYTSKEFISDPKLLEKILYPEDFEKMIRHHEDVYQFQHRNEIYELEFRIIKKDSSVVNIYHVCRPIFDENNNFLGRRVSNRDITERKQSEAALQQSHEMLIKLSDQVPGVVYQYRLYPDGSSAFPFASVGMNMIYEVTPEEVREDATPVFGRLHPDDFDYVANLIQESARTLEMFHCEFRVILPRQGLRWRLSDARPERMSDGGTLWYGIISDVTERKRAEKALIENEEKFRKLTETASDAIISIDSKGDIISWNNSAVRVFGFTSEEVLGKNVQIIIPRKYRPAHTTGLEEASLGNEPKMLGKTINIHGVRKDKKIFPIELALSSWESADSVFYTAIIRDITERVKTEQELSVYHNHLEDLVKARTDELNKVNEFLRIEIEKEKEFELMLQNSLEKEKELNEIKTRFISTTSHEFRTPLTSVLSSTELLQRYSKKWSEDKLNVHFNRIKGSVEYLVGLLDDVLTISRAERGKIAFNPENVDLKTLALEYIDDARTLIKNHQLNFNYKSKRTEFSLDPKLMKFMIGNLLSNAIKYSPDGGKIDLNISTDKKHLLIEVSDEGIGIPASEIEFIFQSFYRTKNAEEISGTGLGLSIVKLAVDLHKGEILVKSEINKGSVFTIKIPRE